MSSESPEACAPKKKLSEAFYYVLGSGAMSFTSFMVLFLVPAVERMTAWYLSVFALALSGGLLVAAIRKARGAEYFLCIPAVLFFLPIFVLHVYSIIGYAINVYSE